MDLNGSNNNAQQCLLVNARRESDVEHSGDHQFSTLADQLGIEEVDAIHNFSNSRSSGSASIRNKYDPPTVVLTQEQVETLIGTLQETGNALKQLTYVGRELKPRRRPRVPRWIVSNLLIITTVWQVLGVVALTLLHLLTQHKRKEKSTFIWTVAILVVVQAFNLFLVFITSVKLTKQFMHHTLTKSFLGQSFLSLTLLFAGLYTLVYNIEHDSFDGPHSSNDISSSSLVFANMLYFSISTATLCGAGHIVPATWYAQLLSSIQMLMSYVYFASVLSIVVHPPKNINFKVQKSKVHPFKTYGTVRSV
ncbi:uncharacterized protein LOC110236052 [Exaiptasia diaphana]|uniref:Potassium channel domain-containing protein n=1 Tax=Exaiptasia diaphana TaxID=2652724 RepID=A0A913X1H2_EXADI|nr:uncharacterized protein LOC110236052 [Exaiptasia diaphana]KXJ16321.1 hypothetical protein AC249_AIPGENE9729 [Exaiptasia diaphana]